MNANRKPALAIIASACLLTGCPYEVKDVVGDAKLISQDYDTEVESALSNIRVIDDNELEGKRIELCEGSSVTLEQAQVSMFEPVKTTTLTGPGVWRPNRGAWYRTDETPDCDDSDDDDNRDDNEDSNEDQQEQQEEEQQEQEQQEQQQQPEQRQPDAETGGDSGSPQGGNTPDAPGGGGGGVLGLGTTPTYVIGGLIGAAVIANQIDKNNDDDTPISQ